MSELSAAEQHQTHLCGGRLDGGEDRREGGVGDEFDRGSVRCGRVGVGLRKEISCRLVREGRRRA